MKKSKTNKKIKSKKTPKYKYFIAIMISLFVIILPFISHLKIMSIDGDLANVFTNSNGIYIDLFLYYKEVLIISFMVFIILFFIGEKIFPDKKVEYPLQERKNKKIIICVIIYSITVVISYLFSKYKNLSLMGSPTECEGIFVLLAYMIFLLAGINYFNNKKSLSILKNSIIILITIIVVLTLIEFFYKPIFEIKFFNQLLAGKEYSNVLASIKNKDYQGMVSLTLYNPNYFGALCVILFPIAFTSFINERKVTFKIYLWILTILMMFCTFVSKSTASVYIIIIQLAIMVIYYRKKIMNKAKDSTCYFIGAILILFTINILSNNQLGQAIITGLTNSTRTVNDNEKFILTDISINNNILEIRSYEDSLIIEYYNEQNLIFKFYDEDNNEITSVVNDNTYTFESEAFKNISMEYLGYGIVVDVGYTDTMEFYISDGNFKGVGQNGIEVEKIKRDKVILPSLYSIATGRGYAWINTIPLLKNSILWGTGPGTFAMYFQQNDYVSMMNTHGTTKLVIDKPHNMYLQVAQQTGILGLIALISIFIIAIKISIGVYIKNTVKNRYDELNLGLGIFIGIVGFLIVSLVNDSIVAVNPIFWILLGVNFAIINYLKFEGK